ncbi:MAG: 8-oxo-dGTP diphosphatase, partial [Lachnospiraceae bacterium]|nr:8-oxo-dGTP diphosphatase [Lachnospiraceae bacterium]
MEHQLPLTTLCYIEKDEKYLMLHRVSKDQDVNKGKWIGVGGHFEPGESPEECLVREVREETGLTVTSWRFRGLLTFASEGWPDEYICLYTADYPGEEMDVCCGDAVRDGATDGMDTVHEGAEDSRETVDEGSEESRADTWQPAGTDEAPESQEAVLKNCDEGVLSWVPKEDLFSLNLWEGDRIFLKLLVEDAPFFSLKLSYHGDELIYAALDGRELDPIAACGSAVEAMELIGTHGSAAEAMEL